MSDDLIERLRQGPVRIIEHYTSCSAEEVDDVEDTMTEAADEISRLRAEVERLTAERDTAKKYMAAYAECDRIGTEAYRNLADQHDALRARRSP